MAEYTASAYEDGTNVFKYQDAAALHPNGTTAQYYRGDGSLATFPTIPTVNNGTLTIQNNGSTVATFGANQSTSVTANITAAAPGNGTLTIKRNNTSVGTFSANQSSNTAINITVPTKTTDLTNDSNFTTHTDVNNALTAHNADTAAHSDIRTALNDEARIRYEYDDNLGTAIQNLGAVKQDNIGWNDSFGGGSMIRIPVYIGKSGTRLLRIRVKYSYGHYNSYVRILTSVNGYSSETSIGFAHDPNVHISQIHLCGIMDANEINDSYRMPDAYLDKSSTDYDIIYLKWGNTTTRRIIAQYVGPLESEDDIIIDTVAESSVNLTSMEVVPKNRQNVFSTSPGTAIGSTTKPVYIDSNGAVTECAIGGMKVITAAGTLDTNITEYFMCSNVTLTVPFANIKTGVSYKIWRYNPAGSDGSPAVSITGINSTNKLYYNGSTYTSNKTIGGKASGSLQGNTNSPMVIIRNGNNLYVFGY